MCPVVLNKVSSIEYRDPDSDKWQPISCDEAVYRDGKLAPGHLLPTTASCRRHEHLAIIDKDV